MIPSILFNIYLPLSLLLVAFVGWSIFQLMMARRILYISFGVFIMMQLIPYGRNHSNPSVVSEPQWDAPRTRELFERVCMDCHSNETEWRWYSKIAPVSWLIQSDVEKGREEFNVSMWGVQEENEGDDAAEEVSEGDMPLWFYYIPRPTEKLTETEKKELIDCLISTFGGDIGDHHDDDR